jgi:hypothetical protein
MRAVSNTGDKSQAFGECHGVAVDARHVEEDLAPTHARKQSCQHRFGAGAVIGDEGPDLVASPAGPDHAPGGKPAVAQQRATVMSGRTDPGSQECRARRRKHRRFVSLDSRKRHL